MSLEYWFVFPISVLIATTAMASGIGGATFFAPLFMLVLGLEPRVAIGTGLITEVFGFASGLLAYSRKRLIDYQLGVSLLMVTIPMALVGSVIAEGIAPDLLKVILGVGLFAVALGFLRAPEHAEISRQDTYISQTYGTEQAERKLVTASGEEIRYTVCNTTEGRLIAGIGGLFVGLISTGLGELNGYFLLQRCRVPSRVAVATGVFVVALTALSASLGHIIQFVRSPGNEVNTVISLAIFTVPGVIIGAQVGSSIASRIPQKLLELGLGILFILIAVLTLSEVILK